MDTYVSTMDAVGESILSWADPDSKFRGYTDVRIICCIVPLPRK
jgi:hypothetical protein